ncbi:hypothetical protein P3T18_004364 [Paraburkholderia sp. GAS199]
MKRLSIAGMLAAASLSVMPSAFASGYGPAPFYRPDVGAPISQRGLSAENERSDYRAEGMTDVGGAYPPGSELGERSASPLKFWRHRTAAPTSAGQEVP